MNLLTENPPGNGTRLIATVTHDNTGEEVYQSGHLDPKQYIDKMPLDVALPKEGYSCAASFNSCRIKDSGYLGRVTAKATIYILN